jgi:3-keto-disaccharide hydrolase
MSRVKTDFPEDSGLHSPIEDFGESTQSPQKEKSFALPAPVLISLVLALIACVVFAMLASHDSKTPPTPTPRPATVTAQPTRPQPTPRPTLTVTVPPPSFSDEFDKGLSNYWSYFLALGEKNDVDISAQGEHVRFTITEYDTYAYLIYELQDYADVRVDTEVTNQGSNNNNAGLVCRFSENGWYEANISSSGVYRIYAFDNNAYRLIWSGGSYLIKIDKETNLYGFECSGEELTVYINGEKVWSGEDNSFSTGKIGLSASTKDYQPVKVDFENITVTEK